MEIQRLIDLKDGNHGACLCSIDPCMKKGVIEVDFLNYSYVLCETHKMRFEDDPQWLFDYHSEDMKAWCEDDRVGRAING